MECLVCKHENPEDAKFCNQCGQNFSIIPSSINKNSPHDKHIEMIQRFLPKGLIEKIMSQKGKIEGEKRKVTVMFCDMEGFTSMVETLGPEKAYAMMDEIYEILIHKVHEFEGTINEMTGDGIMALFGAPVALEDAPIQALRAALSIHDRISNFNNLKNSSPPIKMRIGIHTGPVVVGALGNDLRVEFKAVGDTVNLASRMEGLAEPESTYVTKATYQLAKELFQFEKLGKKEIKGKKEPVLVYKLISGKKDVYRPRIGLERMIYSEMVGRDKELDKIELQVMKAINGEGSIINIIGEAGIGKSRLIAELKKREVIKRGLLLEGRAISIGKNLSFHPIIDLLKQWAKIVEDDSQAKAFHKLEMVIRDIHPEETDEILPFVAILMGLKLTSRYKDRIKQIDGDKLEKLIIKSMRELLIKGSEKRPIVIIIEDLHWADKSSIDLLEMLYTLARNHMLVFINVFRPGYIKAETNKIATLDKKYPDHCVQITIQPLMNNDTRRLIINMLMIRGLPYRIQEQIIDRVGGNPFFTEEVIRSLIDRGAIIKHGDHFKATDKIEHVVIPTSINDVLISRIDRLEEGTRELVKIASVIGRHFFYRLIKDVSTPMQDIDTKLTYLKDVQLIRERIHMEELEYLFKHALVQEAAYESILLKQRKTLHLKVAQSIERIFQDRLNQFYGMLAYHFGKADEPEKTEEYMIKAGQEALQSSASCEALNYFQDALTLYMKRYGDDAEPEKLISFEKNLALAHFNQGSFSEAIINFDSILEKKGHRLPQSKLIQFIKCGVDLFYITVVLFSPFKFKGRVPTPQELEIGELQSKKCVSLVAIDSKRFFFESSSLLRMYLGLNLSGLPQGKEWVPLSASAFLVQGLTFLGSRLLDHAGGFSEDQNGKTAYGFALPRVLLAIHTGLNKFPYDLDLSLVDRGIRNGDLYVMTPYLLHLGSLKLELGLFDEARLCAQKLYFIYESYGYDFAKVHCHFVNANFLIKKRSLHQALKEVEKGGLVAEQKGLNVVSLRFIGIKILVQILLGQVDAAAASMNKGDALFASLRTVGPLYLAPFLLGRLLTNFELLKQSVRNKSPDIGYQKKQTHQSLKQAVKISKKHVLYRVWIYRTAGEYFWFAGKHKIALKWQKKAIKEGENLGARPDLARTYFEVGKCLMEPQSKCRELNDMDSQNYLNKAGAMFEEMDLQYDLDELDRLIYV